jgi:hypothetical protein
MKLERERIPHRSEKRWKMMQLLVFNTVYYPAEVAFNTIYYPAKVAFNIVTNLRKKRSLLLLPCLSSIQYRHYPADVEFKTVYYPAEVAFNTVPTLQK